MAYKVIGAAAVVELDDGNKELNTGTKVYVDEDGTVPPNAKKAHIEHLLAVGLIEKVSDDAEIDDVDGAGPIPAKYAAKADWVSYAVSQGADPAEAEAETKEALIAAYGTN